MRAFGKNRAEVGSMKDFRYTVDGEKVTLDEIAARVPKDSAGCPLVSRATVSNRVRLGWRTWAELSKKPDVVQSNRRKGARR